MEKWAERIAELLREQRPEGKNATALAKACGISQPSVSQWFNDNDSKPATKMILADNLVAAAKYLDSTPEWVLHGKGVRRVSQSAGLNVHKLEVAIVSVRKMAKDAGLEMDEVRAAAVISWAYSELRDYPETLTKAQMKDFDALVRHKLRGEQANDGTGRLHAHESPRGVQTPAPAKAKAGRGRG